METMRWCPDEDHDKVVYVYLLTNTYNDKKYVGISYQPPIRWMEHFSGNLLISKALQKYGFEHFTKEILAVSNRNGALQLERHFCEVYNTLSPNGYNLVAGGTGCTAYSDEWRKECSIRNSGSNNPMFGKTHSASSKNMMRTNKIIENIPSGSQHHNSKLTEEVVRKIRTSHECGESSKTLSEIYNVSVWAIRDIIRGRTWKNISVSK